MKRFMLLMLAAIMLTAFGCSGGNVVAPDDRSTMDDFLATCPELNGYAGSFSITDQDGLVVGEGSLVRNDAGKLSLDEMRTGEVLIDLTWLNWVDMAADFYDARWYQPNGWPVYYYGDLVKYDILITNYAITIPNAILRVQHKYTNGPYVGQILPKSERWWFNVTIPGETVTKLYDEYHALAHGWIAVWGMIDYPVNFWFIHLDLILYNGIFGLWEP